MKDPNDKNRLLIDPEAASVVRLIQNLMMQGLGVVKICRELEAQKILKPAAYKALKGDKRFARYLKDPSKNYKWQPATVQKILKDITYLGCLDNHRTEVINYKTKQRVTIPQNEHIVVENTQEALLAQDNYDIIQHLMHSRHRAQKHDYENIFKRIVFCAHCGGRMHIARKEKKSGEEILTYRCLESAQLSAISLRTDYDQIITLDSYNENTVLQANNIKVVLISLSVSFFIIALLLIVLQVYKFFKRKQRNL